jgi:hypothetical protein
MLKLRDGTKKSASYSLTRTCIKPTNKLISSYSGAPLVLGQSMGNFGLTWLTTAQIRGKSPPPPYSILCASLRHPHLDGFLSRDSQGGVPKLSRFGLPELWAIITLFSDLQLRWGLWQTCSSPQELSNGVSHSTCTHPHRGWVDSRLLVVGSQTVNLSPDLFFLP